MKPARTYDYILWDFNGTLLDDLRHGINTVNTVLRRRGLPTVDTLERYYSLFGFPIEDYYRKLGLLDKEPYDKVAVEWIDEYRKGEKDIPARKGAVELVRRIHDAGIKEGVLSATETEMLRTQLGYLHLLPYFDEILGREDIYAAGKEGIARAFREKHPEAKVLMIGDTDHDKMTADAGGFDCVLVCGGHQSPAYLMTLGCDIAPDFPTLEKSLFEESKQDEKR